MHDAIIQLEGLSKHFGRGKKRVHAVVDNTLNVSPRQVYGFLGPNGAGKTTVIRLLLDLLRPSAGQALLFGQPVADVAVRRRVGAIVEGPAFYPYLTGRKNLRVIARTHGLDDGAAVDAALERVDLRARADRRYRTYSLGMKQRLGLAAALLHDPDLLILDEPTNGLDPAGILEMRRVIRSLVDDQGKTVFLSSHLLNEVEQVCDRVAIIHQGRIVREGPVAALLDGGTAGLTVHARPRDAARAALVDAYPLTDGEGELLDVGAPADAAPDVVRRLVAAGVDVWSVTARRQSLEDYFLAVVGTPLTANSSAEGSDRA